MNIKSRVNFVKTKMADRHLTQPVKDVSISTLLDRDFPITTLMLCEVYPDAQLNTTTMTWALYTFTISTLMDVWTTWGNHQVLPPGITSPSAASGCSWTFQHQLLWSRGYLCYLAFTITGLKDVLRCLQPVFNLRHHLLWSGVCLAITISSIILTLGVKKGSREGGHGEEREEMKDMQGCATMKSSSY